MTSATVRVACCRCASRRFGLYNYHYSTWKPDAEELALLNAGGVVELCCVGIQPPVSVGVVPEFIVPEKAPKGEPDYDLIRQMP